MPSRNYKYYQPNARYLKDNYGDCVVRSLVKAMNSDWLSIFDELVTYAREYQCMPNSKECYEAFLKGHEFSYTSISNKKGSKRPTVDSFAKSHKSGTYILVVANHLVCCVDGIYYDTWESGDKSMYGYWEK